MFYTTILVNTKHLYNICTMLDQRRRRWADVAQMSCKCFVFTGMEHARITVFWLSVIHLQNSTLFKPMSLWQKRTRAVAIT